MTNTAVPGSASASSPFAKTAPSDPAAIPTQTQTTNQAVDPAAPQKSPLDVLEEILNEAQAKQSATAAENEQSAEAQKAAEEEAKLAEVKAQEAAQVQQDLIATEQQKQAIQAETNSDAYKARVQQETQKKTDEEHHAEETKGYEIIQLGHTKV